MSIQSVKTIHTLPLGPKERVYFRRIHQNGRCLLEMRLWKRHAGTGKYRPTRCGFIIHSGQIGELDQVCAKFKIAMVLQTDKSAINT